MSGTPSGGGAGSSATIQVADAKASAAKQFEFNVFGKLVINPISPLPAHLNSPYSLSISGQGSASAIASWTIVSGQVPPGLSLRLNPLNAGVAAITGIPTQTGMYTFTIQAEDYTIPQMATASVTIGVDSNLSISKVNLKPGGQNQPYSDSFAAVNGTPPIHWTASGLPPGLSVDAASGQVTGTPSGFGGYPYTVSATDSSATVQTDSAPHRTHTHT
jgi:large repetitive protein